MTRKVDTWEYEDLLQIVLEVIKYLLEEIAEYLQTKHFYKWYKKDLLV